MISINFWNFSKRKNSTALPSGTAVSYNCEIKEPSDLTSPQLLLNLGQSEAPAYNYAQIPAFSRYYFITEWRFDRGLWIGSLQVDVLASYKTQIGSQSMYVARSASSYDGTIKDMFYPSKAVSTVVDSVISTSTGNQSASPTFTQGYFVVEILGNNPASGSSVYYQMTPATFQDLISQLFVQSDGYDWGDIAQGLINSIMNPMQYIVGCRWYPYPFNGSAVSSGELWCGYWKATGLTGLTKLSGGTAAITFNVTIPKHPQASTRGMYMNTSPYSRYYLEWGSIYPIDSSLIAEETNINITIDPDFTSQNAILRVNAGSNIGGKPLVIASLPYGQEIPMTQQAIASGSLLSIASGGAEIAGAVAGFAAGGPAGAAIAAGAAGAGSMIQGVAETGQGVTSVGSSSGAYNVVSSIKRLKSVFFTAVDDDVAEFGRPLMQTKVINTLSGFIRCQNDDIQIACLDSEREQIRGYMTGGFFYE